ncbi:ACT domain-containing protein [Deinococcus navajonensis]|uniref:ACT domain-containing protein n=1 Tax=Deinococcus navajonensis TaxID=309884 RepID=A0ABV8XPI7_9DEIO
MSARLTLSVLPERYAVVQLSPGAPPPVPVGALWSLTRTPDELSLVCEEAQVPPGVKVAGGWVAFKLHGPFEFTLTGILASVLDPLRDAGVGIFALSTFDTDYVLVQADTQSRATAVLRAAAHTVLEG